MTQQNAKIKAGRPTKLTPELQEEIVNHLRDGNYIETVCAFVGVSKNAIYEWMKIGAKQDVGIYKDFNDAVKKAMAECEVDIVRRILLHGREDWKALAWFLERTRGNRFTKKDHITAEVETTHVERTEAVVEHHLQADPISADLVKQLFRRQQALEHDDTL